MCGLARLTVSEDPAMQIGDKVLAATKHFNGTHNTEALAATTGPTTMIRRHDAALVAT